MTHGVLRGGWLALKRLARAVTWGQFGLRSCTTTAAPPPYAAIVPGVKAPMQDGKNLVIAIVLCLVVIVGWSYLAEYMGWVQKPDPAVVAQQQQAQQQQVQQAEAQRQAQEAARQETLAVPAFAPSAGQDVTVRSPLYEAVLYSGGGALRSFKLKNYHTTIARRPLVSIDGPADRPRSASGAGYQQPALLEHGPMECGRRQGRPHLG